MLLLLLLLHVSFHITSTTELDFSAISFQMVIKNRKSKIENRHEKLEICACGTIAGDFITWIQPLRHRSSRDCKISLIAKQTHQLRDGNLKSTANHRAIDSGSRATEREN